MLNVITVRGFQPYETEQEVRFVPGVNLIVGESDCGKSALIRALYWLFFNRPNGTSIINHKAQTCRVTVELDHHIITKTRSASDNSYSIDGTLYEKIGKAGVPELLVGLIDTVNFQLQHDGLYLINDTNSQVLNRIFTQLGLDLLLNVRDTVAKRASDAKKRAQIAEQGQIECRDKLSVVEGELSRLEPFYQKHKQLYDRVLTLRESVRWLVIFHNNEVTLRRKHLVLSSEVKSLKCYRRLKEISESLDLMYQLREKNKQLRNKDSISALLSFYVEYANKMSILQAYQLLDRQRSRLVHTRKITKLLTSYQQYEKKLQVLTSLRRIVQANDKYRNIKKQLVNLPLFERAKHMGMLVDLLQQLASKQAMQTRLAAVIVQINNELPRCTACGQVLKERVEQ